MLCALAFLRDTIFSPLARAMRRYLIDYALARPDANFVPIEGLVGRALHDKSKIELAATADSLDGRAGRS